MTIHHDKKKASMAMAYTVRIAFAVCVASAMLLAASAMDIPSEYDVSTVTGLSSFDEVTNESTKRDSQGCEEVRVWGTHCVLNDSLMTRT